MQHFDNGHLPEPDQHLVDEIALRARTVAVLTFLVGVEALGLGVIAFGAYRLSGWLTG